MPVQSAQRAETVPDLNPALFPPMTFGTAVLAHRAFAGQTLEQLLALVNRPAPNRAAQSALMLDASMAYQLGFEPDVAATVQAAALQHNRLYRVADVFGTQSTAPLRMLALVAPGNVMVNTPLDFITGHLDIRLDLLFLVPGENLPPVIPDHDIAFFAVSESEPGALFRLESLYAAWPRPVLNDPASIARLSRDTVARGLAGVPGLCSPITVRRSHDMLLDAIAAGVSPLPDVDGPLLLRPLGSHAGHGLQKADDPAQLAECLANTEETEFYVTQFVDYRDQDGLYRKYRVVMVEGAPYLAHMASSEHWMVHYLNAGMVDSPVRRDAEAASMANFDDGFAARHAKALAGLDAWVGLDYYQIDCAETPDGELLVFELDVAAIVHLMDPPDLFPYKPAQMRKVFAAFDTMVRRRAAFTLPPI
ncbi:MAG: hypothetical protein NVSMB18_12250 [Acetobacteraceae bacterium]